MLRSTCDVDLPFSCYLIVGKSNRNCLVRISVVLVLFGSFLMFFDNLALKFYMNSNQAIYSFKRVLIAQIENFLRLQWAILIENVYPWKCLALGNDTRLFGLADSVRPIGLGRFGHGIFWSGSFGLVAIWSRRFCT